MNKTFYKIFVGLISINFLNFAYAAEIKNEDKLASKQELKIRVNGIGELDPYHSSNSSVLLNLCETLVNSDNFGNIIPAAASSWQTKDNKTFVFKLRKNAKWSNGKPVTADDFVYSFRRAADSKYSRRAKLFFSRMFIKNIDAIIKGTLPPSALGVKALDKYTLQIELDKPAHFLLQTLTSPNTLPVNRENIEKNPQDWSSPSKFVCNGAYKTSKSTANTLEAVRNNFYWDNANSHINKVTWQKTKGVAEDAEDFFNNKVQITYRVPLERFWVIEKEYPDEIKNSDKISTYYLAINQQRSPFTDVRVRQALSYAIDRNILTFAYLAQGHNPSYFFTPANTNGFEVDLPDYAKMTQKQRTEKAKELLKKAGFSAKNPARITISYEHSDRNIINYKAVTAIKNIVETSVDSIKITMDPIYERSQYLSRIRSRDYQVMRRGGTGNFNDPITFLNAFISTNDSLNLGYKNTKFDQLMKKIVATVNSKERNKLYAQAENILQEDMPVIPLYRGGHTKLISSKIGNYPVNNPEEKFYVKDLYIKE